VIIGRECGKICMQKLLLYTEKSPSSGGVCGGWDVASFESSHGRDATPSAQ
jgi:hypothetical protein